MLRRSLVFLLLTLLVVPVVSHAQYTVVTVDVPFAGARNPEVTGILLGQETIGLYVDTRGQSQSFLALCGGPVVPLVNHILLAQSAAGRVGWRTAPTGHTTGFLLQDGTPTDLQVPLGPRNAVSTFSEALHLNSAGVTVGAYLDAAGVGHGFRYDPSSQIYTTIDVPEAETTALIFIADDGRILAKAVSAQGSVTYWLWESGTFTALTLPNLPNLQLVARTAGGRLLGNTPEAVFLFDGTTVELFSVPSALHTQLFGVHDEILLGRYTDADDVQHGFVAFPAGVADPCDAGARKDKREGDTRPPRHGRPHH